MLKSPALPTLCLLTLALLAGLPLAGCKKQVSEQIDFKMGERVTATAVEVASGVRHDIYDVAVTNAAGNVLAQFRGRCARLRNKVP